jgi:hypothetical protein
MEIKLIKQMRNISLEVAINEDDEKEALAKALIFTQPDICGICQEQNIVWDAHKAKIKEKHTYTSIKRKCLSCGAVSTLGEFRAGGQSISGISVPGQRNHPPPVVNPRRHLRTSCRRTRNKY